MAQGTFGTAINCIDGRAQGPVTEWVKTVASVDYVDTVTAPGVDNVLAQEQSDQLAALRQSVAISVNAHNSRMIVVAGHFGCAAFDADREQHVTAIRKAVQVVQSWGLNVHVVGLWVNDHWQVEQVA